MTNRKIIAKCIRELTKPHVFYIIGDHFPEKDDNGQQVIFMFDEPFTQEKVLVMNRACAGKALRTLRNHEFRPVKYKIKDDYHGKV